MPDWVVEFHPECEKWADSLDRTDAEALLAAIRVLRDQGPALGRPLVDGLENSRHANLPDGGGNEKKGATMSLKDWEAGVLEADGAPERVAEIEDELRLAAGLTALRERSGLTQAEVATRIGVSQPRVAAIERSSNVTIDLLERYVGALVPGGSLEIVVVQGRRRFPLLTAASAGNPARAAAPSASALRKAAVRRSVATRKTAAKGIGVARKKAS